VRPFPDSRKVPGEAYPEDPRPRKAYFLCLTKKTAQVGGFKGCRVVWDNLCMG
jgi:hypothetical protein